MPATYFHVIWPDGERECCYSPSSVIGEYLEPGKAYTVSEFARVSEQALAQASERVKAKFGFYCSSASDQSQKIQHKCEHFIGLDNGGTVKVERMASAPE